MDVSFVVEAGLDGVVSFSACNGDILTALFGLGLPAALGPRERKEGDLRPSNGVDEARGATKGVVE